MENMWYTQHYLFWLFPLILPLVIIDVALKTVSLWKAARNNQLYWFIALALISSAGVLPLIYILFFQKKRKGKK